MIHNYCALTSDGNVLNNCSGVYICYFRPFPQGPVGDATVFNMEIANGSQMCKFSRSIGKISGKVLYFGWLLFDYLYVAHYPAWLKVVLKNKINVIVV